MLKTVGVRQSSGDVLEVYGRGSVTPEGSPRQRGLALPEAQVYPWAAGMEC